MNLIGFRLPLWGLCCLAHCVPRSVWSPTPRVQDDFLSFLSSHLSLVAASVAAYPVVAISLSVFSRPGPLSHHRRRRSSHPFRHCRRPTAVSPVSRSHRRVYLVVLVGYPAWGSPPWRLPEAHFRSPTASPSYCRIVPLLFGQIPQQYTSGSGWKIV